MEGGGGGVNFRFCQVGHNCYEGGHIAHGGPPTRENLTRHVKELNREMSSGHQVSLQTLHVL